MIIVLMVSIVWFWFSAIIIMGETVFWRLDFIETLYANMGTDPLAVWTTVFWIVEMLIQIVGYLWTWGVLGWVSEQL